MAAASDDATLHATFVMEQHLGHRTFSENLRRSVEGAPGVRATWVDVSYAPAGAVWERVPGLDERTRGTLRGRREVRHGCRGHRSDVTFFNTQVPAVIGGRRVRSAPYVVCTDITPLQYDRMASGYGHQADEPGPLARAKHLLNRRVFRAAARTVGWSSWVGQSMIDDYGVDPGRLRVIPPGVDTSRWKPADRAGGGPMRVLFVGGDLQRKGGQLLMEAFRSLPHGIAELVLVTRTPHPGGPGIRVEHGMSPNSPELISLYQSSDVFVLPTSAEAFGIAAVEAAAVGLPVLATRVGGLPDIVVEGETGYLINPGGVGELRQHLLALAHDEDLRQRMGEAARKHVERHFDAAANGRRIVEVLREAVRAPAATAG